MSAAVSERMRQHDPTVHPSPPAVRLRRPGWRDPRLLVGVVLVAASVTLGSWLVATAGRTVPVYAADGPLVAGETVSPDRLVVTQVRLGSTDLYLPADRELPRQLVVVRTVAAGELVPLSALGAADELDVRPVAVSPGRAMSSGVREGSRVDLWFVPAAPQARSLGGVAAGTSGGTSVEGPTPYPLATGLTVAEVSEPDGAFAAGSGVTVHVLVPVEQLADVLAALAADGTVEVVPVPGTARQP